MIKIKRKKLAENYNIFSMIFKISVILNWSNVETSHMRFLKT